MGCCGRIRQQIVMNTAPATRIEGQRRMASTPQQRAGASSRVFFEYVGQTGLTVKGPVSGRQYRFDRPGARQEIDLRDRPALATLRNLRQLVYNTT